MSRFIAKMTLTSALAVSLTACAQMSFVGDNVWDFTKSTANFVTKPVAKLLRPAPSQHYVFESSPRTYQTASSNHYIKSDFDAHSSANTHNRVVVPKLNHLPVTQTHNHQHVARLPSNDYHNNQYKPQPYQRAAMRSMHKPAQSKLIPRRIVRQPYKPTLQTQPVKQVQNQTQDNKDISFVKIGGGSNMSDWTSCQQQAGSYYQMTQTIYRIDPNFENCMRGKGYKLESEAKAELNL